MTEETTNLSSNPGLRHRAEKIRKRWLPRGMPKPVEPTSLPWSTVEVFREHITPEGQPALPMSWLAVSLGVNRSTLGRWKKAGEVPTPYGSLIRCWFDLGKIQG